LIGVGETQKHNHIGSTIVQGEPLEMKHINHLFMNLEYSESYTTEDSFRSPKLSPNKHRRKMILKDKLHVEFHKEKSPTFDGKAKFGQDIEAWTL
jgi:hypothetical protein